MLILKPISKERIWGTPRLHKYSGDESIEKIGSIYSLSAIEGLSNEIVGGDFLGESFYDVINNNPDIFGLKRGEVYPIIISFTACDDNLSVQVHPGDEYAKRNKLGLYGKSESWYFIEPPKNGWIYSGTLVDRKEKIAQLISSGQYEKVVGKEEVNKDDLVFIPSSTLHAMTAGSLVYEIQQATDITYRFYDYDRLDSNGEKRELHLDSAINALDLNSKVKRAPLIEGNIHSEYPYSIIKKELKGSFKNENAIAIVITVIEGNGKINNELVQKGVSIIVLPGEIINIDGAFKAIVAIPRAYWR